MEIPRKAQSFVECLTREEFAAVSFFHMRSFIVFRHMDSECAINLTCLALFPAIFPYTQTLR